MASPTRTLTVNIVGRTDSVDKAFKRVSKGSSLMSDRLAKGLKIGGLAFAALGGAAIAAARTLGPMIQKAADIEESLSKNKVLFGEASVAVEKWSERTTKSLGISRREALEAVGNFGALTHAMGMSGEEGSKMSMQLVDLAADMASFNNASPEETLTAIAAGLRGENEPLRRFGVLLDAATLKTKALEKGLISSTKDALTPQTKALAAYSEILGQTEVQQGDFQRTSDGLANQQKLLAATWDDLQASIGEKLQPAFLSIVTAINDHVLPALQDLIEDPSLENFGEEFGKIFYNTVLDGMDDAEKENPIPTTFEGYLADQATDPGLAAKLANWGLKFFRGIKDGIDTAARQASILEAVEELKVTMAAEMGEEWAAAWVEAFNREMSGEDFVIPELEGRSFEELNPQGSKAAQDSADAWIRAKALGLNDEQAAMLADPNFGQGAAATDSEIAAELKEFERLAAAATAGLQQPDTTGTTKTISNQLPRTPGPTLLDPRAAAFGAKYGSTVNVTINAPAVTPDEVQTAIVKGFTDNSVGLSDLYFI